MIYSILRAPPLGDGELIDGQPALSMTDIYKTYTERSIKGREPFTDRSVVGKRANELCMRGQTGCKGEIREGKGSKKWYWIPTDYAYYVHELATY